MGNNDLNGSLMATPAIRVEAFDREITNGRVVGVHVGDSLTIQIAQFLGDAAVVAVAGMFIDAFAELRDNARQRIAAEHTGLPAPEDGLEPASLADAVEGWAPGEIVEVFGS